MYEEGLLGGVGEGPLTEQSLHQGDGQTVVFTQEKHGAAEQLFVVHVGIRHLVKRNYDVLEEPHVFFTEGDCETRYDGG